MFGFLKSKPAPEGPVTIDFDIEIGCAAEDVYALIDFADPRNAKKQVGTVEPTGNNTFRMELDLVPDMVFDLRVTEAARPQVYAFDTRIAPQAGRLTHSHERYEIKLVDRNSCILRLITDVTFEKGMTMRQFEEEVTMMSRAVHNALLKLKIHAEKGVDVVRQIERAQIA
ncbi:hypothetical protein M3P36_03710 [Altererythrobacter sp. KTW20L]|uniref:hypothetical protein n=1 Tax=Altererythrobacter sp. KTW20L TaxID=2942210 RepID=UPI0020BF5C2B|nr:hypothetical protein [Altererythrobacter sp. KTW20L]MCL6250154.1 hypothetical protein [Altererythrobacter sp. KTW20L]